MKVLILHQYFKTPEEGGGIRSWYLARALQAAGHQVTVVTTWNKGKKATLTINGATVHYLPVSYSNHMSAHRRIWAFAFFNILSLKTIFFLPKPHIVYAISTPLTTGLVAVCLRKLTGVPFIFEVGDLWPKVPIQMGIIRNKGLICLLTRLEHMIYRQARHLVAMSPAIESFFQALGHGQKTTCVTNFADLFWNEQIDNKELTENTFWLAYTGALGRANHLSYLINLAEEAQRRGLHQFKCLIMGDGAEKKMLENLVNAKKLENVTFVAHGSKAEAMRMLKRATMAYLSFGPHNMLWTGSPNKYFDALALGKPILCNFQGWLAKEIEEQGCGITYPASNPGAFFDTWWKHLLLPDTLPNMQIKALELAKEKYSLEKQVPHWLEMFHP